MKVPAVLCLAIVAAGCGGSSAPETEPPGQAPAQDQAAGAGNGDFVDATAAEHAEDSPEPSPLVAPADAPLLEQEIAYGEAEGANLTGFLAMPRDVIEPPPGILVIHEWWGLNDNIRAMTRQLAAQGYIALAVDLYGDAVTDEPARAEELMRGVTMAQDAARSNLRQAYEYLSEYALSPRIGVIGWCLGGGWALQTALMLPEELDAAVMYYGRLETDEAALAKLSTPLLGFFGELDESIPARDVRVWRSRLRDMGKSFDIYVYPDVGHAFANPSGGNYDAETAAESWEETLTFLERHLQ